MKKWVSSYPYETQVRTSESRSRSAIWHIGKLSDKYFLFTVKDYGRIFNSVCLQAWHKDILGTTPQRFREFKNLCGNLGCSEIFIETPKDLEMQRATWAEYKHHNTVKSLICSPNFISKACTGRLDQKSTLESGFLDHIPQFTTIMADLGFNLTDECTRRNIHFEIPPAEEE